jgi:uncharacterized protein YdeI (YjbR/CyaY-like superfamily)
VVDSTPDLSSHRGKPAFYPRDRSQWRNWLRRNASRSSGVWVVFYKKASGPPRVSYDEAVEEALCFGWIDSVINGVDDDRFVQWFSPRKARGTWSALNKRRIADLERRGRMTPAGRAHVQAAIADGRWTALDANERLDLPEDLARALNSAKARHHWDQFSPSSRKGILNWIGSAKRDETRAKRVAETARLAARGLRAQFDRDKPGYTAST